MKNIPTLIKVANRDIQVKIEALDDNLYGMYTPNTLTISLNKKNSPVIMVETFWHELIHAINDYNRVQYEIRLEISRKGEPDEQAYILEETITNDFANVFMQVIKVNNLLAL